jgi:hypothetical protein
MAVATWQEVAVALGRPSDSLNADQQAQITYWLNGVELLIKSRLGPIADLDQDIVEYVETEAVAEKARPYITAGGATSVTVTADDGTVTRRYERVTVDDVTDDLWALFGSGFTASAYTVAVTSPLDLP